MRRARTRGDRKAVRQLRHELRQIPSGDPQDPGFRRLRYSRYADDHLLGFIGPKAEAEAIKDQLARYLRGELALELNQDKTLITHARTRAARYLGYEIIVQHANDKLTNGRREVNGVAALRVPLDVIKVKRALNGATAKRGTGQPCKTWTTTTSSRRTGPNTGALRGYYMLAHDVWRFGALRWDAETSMLKTLAAKHQSTVAKMAAKYKANNGTHPTGSACASKPGSRRCEQARPGSQVRRDTTGTQDRRRSSIDRLPGPPPHPRKELINRLLTRRCELCGNPGKGKSHQVRKLASLGAAGPGQPAWAAKMAKKRRKTLDLSALTCHESHPRPTLSRKWRRSPESYVHRKVPAWFGGGEVGKGPFA